MFQSKIQKERNGRTLKVMEGCHGESLYANGPQFLYQIRKLRITPTHSSITSKSLPEYRHQALRPPWHSKARAVKE